MKSLLRVSILLFLSTPMIAADNFGSAVESYQKGDFAAAENILTNLLRAEPRDTAALGLLGAVLDAQKKYSEAAAAYERAIKISPDSPSLLNNFGNHFLATGDTSAARAEFVKVVAFEPHHPNANMQLAMIAADEKKGTAVLEYLNQIPKADQGQPSIQMLRMRALYLTSRDSEADQIRSALASSKDPRIEFSLGLALARAGKYKESEQLFSRTLEEVPGDFDVLYNLGLAAFHAGDRQRAREVLEIAATQRPEDVDALYNLAIVEIDLNQREPAIPLLVESEKLAPTRANVVRTLAETESAVGYYRDAAAAYDRYLKLVPGDQSAQRERAFLTAVCGNRKQGISGLESVLRSHPDDVTAHYELAVVSASSDPSGAAAQLQKALTRQPDFAPARFARGVLNCLQGKFSDALPDLEFARARYPDNTIVLDRLAKTYIDLNRYQDAIPLLRKATQISPRDGSIFIHLSRAYAGAGKVDESRAALARYRAIGSEQIGRIPPLGFADLLSQPSDKLYAQYRAEVINRLNLSPQDPDLSTRYLKLLIDEGKKKEAEAQARKLLDLKPPAPLAAEAGRALLGAEEYESARSLLDFAAANFSGSDEQSEIQTDLAIAVFHTAGPEAALAELDRIPAIYRKGDYFLARAQLVDALGQDGAALEALETALRYAPNRPGLLDEAAAFLVKHQRPREALELMEQAARRFPEDRKILLLQAGIFAFAGRASEAEHVLTRIENHWPEWPDAYVTYGILLEGQKRADEAKAQLEAALALGASSAQLHYYLAKATLVAAPDRLDQAAKEIAQAVALSPSDASIQALAGRIAYSERDYKGAVEHLEQAIRLRPDSLDAHYTLAQAYRALGLKDEAVRESRAAERLRADDSTPAGAPVRELPQNDR